MSTSESDQPTGRKLITAAYSDIVKSSHLDMIKTRTYQNDVNLGDCRKNMLKSDEKARSA